MSHEEAAMTAVLQRLGITVSRQAHSGQEWGWSMQNDRLSRPWVGAYATRADATAAALDWLMETAWRGVLYPILQASSNADLPSDAMDDDSLLDPWRHVFARESLTVK